MANPPPQVGEHPMAVVIRTLQSDAGFKRDINTFLPPNIDRTKFLTAAIAAVQRNADVLAQCDRQSVYNAIADAASRGLIPDGRQGAIVPFNTPVKRGDRTEWVTKAQFLIMPEGIIELATRAGIHVYAVSVYERDHIELWNDGDGMHVKHDYNPFGDRGERVGAMAVGRARDGTVYVEAISMEELDRIQKLSKQKDADGNPKGPWKDFRERMEQKSSLHRLFKRMPGFTLPDDEEWQPQRLEIAREPVGEAPKAVGMDARRQQDRPVPGTPERLPGRPAALQRMVDKTTGEVYTNDAGGGGAPPGSATVGKQQPAGPSPPPPAPSKPESPF